MQDPRPERRRLVQGRPGALRLSRQHLAAAIRRRSQPGKYDDQPTAPLGTVLLGHPTAFEQLTWTLPDPPVLGFNGAFNAYRVLEQDVVGFEAFLDQAASSYSATPAAGELLPPGSGKRRSATGERRRPCARWSPPSCAAGGETGTPL